MLINKHINFCGGDYLFEYGNSKNIILFVNKEFINFMMNKTETSICLTRDANLVSDM